MWRGLERSETSISSRRAGVGEKNEVPPRDSRSRIPVRGCSPAGVGVPDDLAVVVDIAVVPLTVDADEPRESSGRRLDATSHLVDRRRVCLEGDGGVGDVGAVNRPDGRGVGRPGESKTGYTGRVGRGGIRFARPSCPAPYFARAGPRPAVRGSKIFDRSSPKSEYFFSIPADDGGKFMSVVSHPSSSS